MNLLKTEKLGTQEEFDEGIAKVKLLRVKSASEFANLQSCVGCYTTYLSW